MGEKRRMYRCSMNVWARLSKGIGQDAGFCILVCGSFQFQSPMVADRVNRANI